MAVIVTSYLAQIKSLYKVGEKPAMRASVLDGTARYEKRILDFCMERICNDWDEISAHKGKERFNFTEKLFHAAKGCTVRYPEFDRLFYKLPSYTRRNILSDAIGKVSSYKSNYRNWEEEGRKGAAPTLGNTDRYQPTFYKEDRSIDTEQNSVIQLRMFVDGDWNFVNVVLKASDMKYVRRCMQTRKMLSPSIQKAHGKYYVRFSFKENVKLVNEDQTKHRVLAVDLGINNAASMCVMEADGTIQGRKVFSLPCENDRLCHTLHKTKGAQQRGYADKRLWRKVRYINRDISLKTAKAIMEMAEFYSADCIVFEKLDVSGKKRGGRKQRLHHWKCMEVQEIVELFAHRNGMRVSRVCAWGTSKLAFDGSGQVQRGAYTVNGKEEYNYSICTFQNGKQYHCDLNASYNIGARYFLRAYQNLYGDIEVSTPQRTLSTLWDYTGNKQAEAA